MKGSQLNRGKSDSKILAFSFPQLSEGMEQREGARAELTAIMKPNFDAKDMETGFALRFVDEAGKMPAFRIVLHFNPRRRLFRK